MVVFMTALALAPAAAALTLFVIADTGDCKLDGAAKVSAAIRAQPDWQQAWLVEAGDLAYPVATRERLNECHEPHFGMFARRIAVPGNHDWRDENGRGFFSLFPEPVPRRVDLDGRWQLWLLNSNLRDAEWDRQLNWLDESLPRTAGRCIIAVWHHPRWSSGKHGDNAFMAPVWQRLAGVATFTLNGHDHDYEALPALDRDGEPSATGTRSFIVGNGGAVLYPAQTPQRASTAAFGRWGFLRLDIDGDRYRWLALDVNGERLDAGNGTCLGSR